MRSIRNIQTGLWSRGGIDSIFGFGPLTSCMLSRISKKGFDAALAVGASQAVPGPDSIRLNNCSAGFLVGQPVMKGTGRTVVPKTLGALGSRALGRAMTVPTLFSGKVGQSLGAQNPPLPLPNTKQNTFRNMKRCRAVLLQSHATLTKGENRGRGHEQLRALYDTV